MSKMQKNAGRAGGASGPRVDRIAEQIRSIVGDILVRQEIKDHRVWDVGLITITHVKVTGDLRQARLDFMVHGLDDKALLQVQAGLNHAAGFVHRRLRRELPIKVIPTVEFRIDRVFASEARVDEVLREIENARAQSPVADHEDDDGRHEGEAGQAEDDPGSWSSS